MSVFSKIFIAIIKYLETTTRKLRLNNVHFAIKNIQLFTRIIIELIYHIIVRKFIENHNIIKYKYNSNND